MNIDKIKKYIHNLSIPNILTSLKNNENKLIGLLFILLLLWVILYFIPTLILTIFDTYIGTFILLIISLLIGFNNIKLGIFAVIMIIIIKRLIHLSYSSKIEGFTTLNNDSVTKFIQIQQKINPKLVFDTRELQKQVTQDELDYFLKNEMWPWNDEVKKLYKESLSKNPHIRTDLDDSMNKARTIYNQSVILQILSWQEKEWLFLQNGILIKDKLSKNKNKNTTQNIKTNNIYFGAGTYGINSGLISDANYSNQNKLIKCSPNPNKNNEQYLASFNISDDGLQYNGKKPKPTFLNVNKLEKLIPNFKFVNKSCNPCVALNNINNHDNKPDYSCPYEINVKNKPFGISNVWQYLWNIDINPLQPLE